MLFLGALLAAARRPEKALVLVGAGLFALLLAFALRGRLPNGPRRSAAALVAVLLAAGMVEGAGRVIAPEPEPGDWSITELVVHARIAYPHLAELRFSTPHEPPFLRQAARASTRDPHPR